MLFSYEKGKEKAMLVDMFNRVVELCAKHAYFTPSEAQTKSMRQAALVGLKEYWEQRRQQLSTDKLSVTCVICGCTSRECWYDGKFCTGDESCDHKHVMPIEESTKLQLVGRKRDE